MSNRDDAFEELVIADPVRRDRTETHASPTAQRILASILNTPR